MYLTDALTRAVLHLALKRSENPNILVQVQPEMSFPEHPQGALQELVLGGVEHPLERAVPRGGERSAGPGCAAAAGHRAATGFVTAHPLSLTSSGIRGLCPASRAAAGSRCLVLADQMGYSSRVRGSGVRAAHPAHPKPSLQPERDTADPSTGQGAWLWLVLACGLSLAVVCPWLLFVPGCPCKCRQGSAALQRGSVGAEWVPEPPGRQSQADLSG